MIKRECGWVITFVYVPFPNFPLQNANQSNKQKNNSTVQQNTNSIPTVWQVMRSPEIK